MPMFGEPKAVSSDSLEISIQDAISIAGKSAEGTVIEAALDVENDSLVYEVEMITGNRSGLKIHIDARNGDIVKISEHEDADQ